MNHEYTVPTDEQHPKSTGLYIESAADFAIGKEGMLKGLEKLNSVPDKFSDTLGLVQRVTFAKKSEERWESFWRTISTKVGDIPDEHKTEQGVYRALVAYAYGRGQTSIHRPMPEDYRRVHALMYWKYLQGAEPKEVNRGAGDYIDGSYRTTNISSVRQGFLYFAENLYKMGEWGKAPELPVERNNLSEPVVSRSDSVEVVALRGLEQSAAQRLRPEVGNKGAERERAATMLGNAVYNLTRTNGAVNTIKAYHFKGAYCMMLGVAPDVLVKPKHLHEARSRASYLVMRNIQAAKTSSIPPTIQLSKEEIALLNDLTGKKFILKERSLALVDKPPLTLASIQDSLSRSRISAPADAQTDMPTADEIERLLLGGLNKIAEFAKWLGAS